MIRFNILDANKELNINKNTETNSAIAKTVAKECYELIDALGCRDTKHIAKEALDVIQVAVNLLYKLDIDVGHEVNIHNFKLIDRGWTFKKTLGVKVCED